EPVVEMAFDPRGLAHVKTRDESADSWVRERETSGAWDYREWQWWKGHPWGDSCRPRYWTTAEFSPGTRDIQIQFAIDGFATKQVFLLPKVVDSQSPHWDLVTIVKNISGNDVEEYGQFFACYTQFNEPRSCWFWEAGDRLTRFADRGVRHLNGYVSHPDAYFANQGAIPHCPRGAGRIVARWHRPVLVSHASPAGWRSVILLEANYAAALAQGIEGAAMDYIVFPGPDKRTFADGEEFAVHVRHQLINSPEMPSSEHLAVLWNSFVAAHETVHRRATELR
ncbi:MAG: hypothetical protein KDA57_16230, partial [Planctomycetales bacterium]|nr:hypothetical protein [Planctomycetales bacterium]